MDAVLALELLLLLAGGYFVMPWLAKAWLTRQLLRDTSASGSVCLTFDDGPDPRFTPRILDILAASGARATFFLLGEQAEKYPDIVRRIASEGHDVGEHGFAHRHAWYTDPIRYCQDLLRGRRALEAIVGRGAVRLFRPAFGEVNALTLIYLQLGRRRLVMWGVNPRDFEGQSGREIAETVGQRLGAGTVVLLHDGRADSAGDGEVTVDAVRRLVNAAVSRGLPLFAVSRAAGMH
jgi:peptidoglycan/xylan/chitin deacetylase (PgdA/CDA1 family)